MEQNKKSANILQICQNIQQQITVYADTGFKTLYSDKNIKLEEIGTSPKEGGRTFSIELFNNEGQNGYIIFNEKGIILDTFD